MLPDLDEKLRAEMQQKVRDIDKQLRITDRYVIELLKDRTALLRLLGEPTLRPIRIVPET